MKKIHPFCPALLLNSADHLPYFSSMNEFCRLQVDFFFVTLFRVCLWCVFVCMYIVWDLREIFRCLRRRKWSGSLCRFFLSKITLSGSGSRCYDYAIRVSLLLWFHAVLMQNQNIIPLESGHIPYSSSCLLLILPDHLFSREKMYRFFQSDSSHKNCFTCCWFCCLISLLSSSCRRMKEKGYKKITKIKIGDVVAYPSILVVDVCFCVCCCWWLMFPNAVWVQQL